MKSNKGIVTTVANISEFILQQRINHSHRSVKLVQNISQELQLLRDQLLPSMEILHFLVEKHNYNVKSKLNIAHKQLPLEELSLSIKFIVNDKINSVSHVAEQWKFDVVKQKEQEVEQEDTTHQMLFLLSQVIKQLNQGQLLNEIIRNHEAARKFIIDFQIQIAAKEKIQPLTLNNFNHLWTNTARIDNSRELVLSCYTNTNLAQLVSSHKKSPYLSSGPKINKFKGTSQSTRKDSSEMNQSIHSRKHRSMDQSPLFEIYDNQLDVTILSSDSDELSGSHIISELNYEDEEEDFELLIEQSNKDRDFIRQNEALFAEWNNLTTTTF